ncbi:class I SAM-dependent methyltransferase [Pseudonocardia sichuanensis]
MKALRARARGGLLRVLETCGVRQSEAGIATAAQRYWSEVHRGRSSHWAGTGRFARGDLWDRIGRRHLDIIHRASKLLDAAPVAGRVVEWGCGGGANAVCIAPFAREFIGVDVSDESLRECGRQVAAHCDTPFLPVQVAVANPETALRDIEGPCDLFLCVYVFELIPSPAYGERILRIAYELLAPGGLVSW